DEPALLLVEAIVKARAGATRRTIRGSSRLIYVACDYIHAHRADPLSVEPIARYAGTHPVYLTRLFRWRMGCTVSTYVQRARVHQAAELLSKSELPAGSVAMAAGFADQSHLCRSFRRHMGLSPGEYRRLVLKRDVV